MTAEQSTAALIKALIQAQKAIDPVVKDANNPYFKSKYADLTGVLDAVLPALHANNLFLTHRTGINEQGAPIIICEIWHESGANISCIMPIVSKDKDDPQKLGSAITYMRRYTTMAILGMRTDEDDDGNGAAHKPTQAPPSKPAVTPKPAAPVQSKPDTPAPEIYRKLVTLAAKILASKDTKLIVDLLDKLGCTRQNELACQAEYDAPLDFEAKIKALYEQQGAE